MYKKIPTANYWDSILIENLVLRPTRHLAPSLTRGKAELNEVKQFAELFFNARPYFTSINSTSKIKVAFGGITPPAPLEPYPK